MKTPSCDIFILCSLHLKAQLLSAAFSMNSLVVCTWNVGAVVQWATHSLECDTVVLKAALRSLAIPFFRARIELHTSASVWVIWIIGFWKCNLFFLSHRAVNARPLTKVLLYGGCECAAGLLLLLCLSGFFCSLRGVSVVSTTPRTSNESLPTSYEKLSCQSQIRILIKHAGTGT